MLTVPQAQLEEPHLELVREDRWHWEGREGRGVLQRGRMRAGEDRESEACLWAGGGIRGKTKRCLLQDSGLLCPMCGQ